MCRDSWIRKITRRKHCRWAFGSLEHRYSNLRSTVTYSEWEVGESARLTGKRNCRPPRMRPQKADGAGACHNPDTPPQIQALKYRHKLNCCLSFRTAANPRLLSCVASLASVYGRCCRTSGNSGSPTLWTKWNRVSAWLKYVRRILWGYRSSDHVSRL